MINGLRLDLNLKKNLKLSNPDIVLRLPDDPPSVFYLADATLNLPVWVDRTRLHSQHAFQQVCLPALAWLLRSHSCGDRSQAAHCRGPSFPPLDRCSPLNWWPHNQHFSSCPVWPLGQWNERTRAFGSSWHDLKKNLDHWCERKFITHFICHLLEVSAYNFEIAEDMCIFPSNR